MTWPIDVHGTAVDKLWNTAAGFPEGSFPDRAAASRAKVIDR
jgi:hypothetical protein